MNEIIYFADCKKDALGRDYSGTLNVTRRGLQCQAWASDVPYIPYVNARDRATFPEGSLEDGKNYCRNPDDDPSGPWCYTLNPNEQWDYCDIKLCPGNILLLILSLLFYFFFTNCGGDA